MKRSAASLPVLTVGAFVLKREAKMGANGGNLLDSASPSR